MSSHLLDSLLGFGYTKSETLSSESEQHLRSLISEAEANISRIDSQIHDLVCQRGRERETLARLCATLAPIRKVPAELLTEIFTLIICRDQWPEHYLYSRWATMHHLSQVCTLWRQIVHNTPRLWTFLDITGDARKKFSDQYMAMIQNCSDRSSPMPISIHIKCPTPGTEAVLRSLFPSANRWQSLQIDGDSRDNGLSCLSDLFPGSLTRLEELFLELYGELPMVEVFLSAQRLRKVTLYATYLSKLPLPWSQLTCLLLRNSNPTTCREILTQCTNIIEATFSTTPFPSNGQITDLPITVLPQLSRLKIMFEVGEDGLPRDAALFFQPLALPALKELVLWTEVNFLWSSSIFTQFQLRSPNIEQFHSYFSAMSGDDLVLFLRHAPALKKLHLDRCCFSEKPFDALRHDESYMEPLAPMLEDLSLEDLDLLYRDRSMACAELMIRSRWWSDEDLLAMPAPPRVARWKNVYISQESWTMKVFSEDFARWMEVSKAQGLQITVK